MSSYPYDVVFHSALLLSCTVTTAYRRISPINRTFVRPEGGIFLDAIFYTVRAVNGDYADLMTDEGGEHSITMFLLPEGTTVGSRLKLENFQWELT